MDGLCRLADAWHRRVLADDVVAHAFSHGFHPQHVERLAAYWAEALGGPCVYSDSYGDETKVVKMHSGNGEHDEMDRRAIACFDRALPMSDWPMASCDRCCTITSRGRPPQPWLAIRSPPPTCLTASGFHTGLGTDSSRTAQPAIHDSGISSDDILSIRAEISSRTILIPWTPDHV